jgi:hypothetical protein
MGEKMLKRSLQTLGLILLVIFSFYYTDRVISVVKSYDPIMIKINDFEDMYNINYINATINNNEIIPGVNGCMVDTNKSYHNMKRIGNYNPNMIEYREITPELSLRNVYDKYIVKGNKTKLEIALIIKVNNINDINSMLNILHQKQVAASFFIDGSLIENNSNMIYEMIQAGHEIYNLGYNGKYERDLLLWTNSMIDSIAKNKSNYCLTLTENQNTLDLCSRNKMHTVKPDIIINISSPFSMIRNNIEKGSLVLFDINNDTSTELLAAINFLTSKGYKFNLLIDHLSEKGC